MSADGRLLEEILAALDRTEATGNARVEVFLLLRPPWEVSTDLVRRQGGLLRPVARRAGVLAKRASEGWNRMHGDGFIDFPGHRAAIDFGSMGHVVVGDRMWSGRSGKPIATLRPTCPRSSSRGGCSTSRAARSRRPGQSTSPDSSVTGATDEP